MSKHFTPEEYAAIIQRAERSLKPMGITVNAFGWQPAMIFTTLIDCAADAVYTRMAKDKYAPPSQEGCPHPRTYPNFNATGGIEGYICWRCNAIVARITQAQPWTDDYGRPGPPTKEDIGKVMASVDHALAAEKHGIIVGKTMVNQDDRELMEGMRWWLMEYLHTVAFYDKRVVMSRATASRMSPQGTELTRLFEAPVILDDAVGNNSIYVVDAGVRSEATRRAGAASEGGRQDGGNACTPEPPAS